MDNGYICGSATIAWIRGHTFGFMPLHCNRVIGERKCAGCARRRHLEVEKRVLGNIGTGSIFIQEVGDKSSDSLSKYFKRKGGWIAKFPISENVTVILSSIRGPKKLSGVEISRELISEKVRLFLDSTPPGKRISFSRAPTDIQLEKPSNKEKLSVLTKNVSRVKLMEIMSDFMGVSTDGQIVYTFPESRKEEILLRLKDAGYDFTVDPKMSV